MASPSKKIKQQQGEADLQHSMIRRLSTLENISQQLRRELHDKSVLNEKLMTENTNLKLLVSPESLQEMLDLRK